MLAWSPLVFGLAGLVFFGGYLFAGPAGDKSAAAANGLFVVLGIGCGLGLGLFALLATVSALMPGRGLQDRLAGTWLVPH